MSISSWFCVSILHHKSWWVQVGRNAKLSDCLSNCFSGFPFCYFLHPTPDPDVLSRNSGRFAEEKPRWDKAIGANIGGSGVQMGSPSCIPCQLPWNPAQFFRKGRNYRSSTGKKSRNFCLGRNRYWDGEKAEVWKWKKHGKSSHFLDIYLPLFMLFVFK